MARKVRTEYRKIKKNNPLLHKALSANANMTTNRQYNYLKRNDIKPLITKKQLAEIIKVAKRKSKLKIKISKDMTRGHRYADGVAIKDGNAIQVRIHPYVQYQGKRYAKDVVNHELDHVKVFKKQIKNKR